MSGEHVAVRWDGFLAQVRERFVQVLCEAHEGCPAVLEQAAWDPTPMGNAWGAIEQRAKELSTKIEETWFAQVERAFEEAGVPPERAAREREKGDALRDWMEIQRERARVVIWADAGRALFERGLAEMGRAARACVRCGAPLSIPFTFRARNVPCAHCRTVNGFEPGAMIRMAEVCVHALCEEAAWEAWLVLHQAERAARSARPLTLQHLEHWERAQLGHLRAYLTKRAELLPDRAGAFEADLEGRMRAFYDRMERESVWLLAGRRRGRESRAG